VDQRRKSAKATSNNFNKLSLLRKLGNSGVLPENPRVGSSVLSLDVSKKASGYDFGHSPLFFFGCALLIEVAEH
jgi:hypothetical protein